MGKYMRKTKTDGEVAIMEVTTTPSPLGVRTRAKTLALQRLQNSAVQAQAEPQDPAPDNYLQLRNRRLEKPPVKRQRQAVAGVRQNPKPNPRASSRIGEGSANSAADGSVSLGRVNDEDGLKMEVSEEVDEAEEAPEKNEAGDDNNGDLGIEASLGENVLEVDGRERGTRESTPCSLIRDPDILRTPGSTTKSSGLTDANRRMQNPARSNIPTAAKIDELFTAAEQDQQKAFMEKYNFDPVNDKPLPGRFEWEKINP